MLNRAQTGALLSAAASMWEFYQDFANESENWLPPDNVQESPVYHTAHRTSPTNIGMLLLSALSARDLELIDTAVMVRQVTNTITTVEKLKKFSEICIIGIPPAIWKYSSRSTFLQ